jgi:hypothetical protein
MFALVEPDIGHYEDAKGVVQIDQRNNILPDLPEGLHNSRLAPHLRFIELASTHGHSIHRGLHYVTFFPGSVLPGPSDTEQYIGALAYDRWKHVLPMAGRGFDLDTLLKVDEPSKISPEVRLDDMPLPSYWIADIPVPSMQLISFRGMLHIPGVVDVAAFEREAIDLVHSTFERDPKIALGLLHNLQSPHTSPPPFFERYTDLALSLFEQYALSSQENPLPLGMQIEQTVHYLVRTENHERLCSLNYRGVYVEAFSYPLEQIHASELADPKRATQELGTLMCRGAFAPILIDEYGMNTDGTHRQVAFMVYNTLHALKDKDISAETLIPLQSELPFLKRKLEFRSVVETLGYLQQEAPEILSSLRNFVNEHDPFIEVPVMVGLEPQACAVVKAKYHEGTTIGLPTPFLYRQMRLARGGLAIGSRGPYHRSDRSIVPWFQVIPEKRVESF